MTSGESGEIINSVASDYFVNSEVSPRDPLLFQQEDESLYDWMKRKQQIGDIGASADIEEGEEQVTITVKEKELPSAAAANAASDDEEKKMAETSAGVDVQPVTPQQQQTKSMHLLDAHIIFEPLLSSLGLMPQQIQNLSLKNLGSNVSILGSINEFRVDIIESEFGGHSSNREANQ